MSAAGQAPPSRPVARRLELVGFSLYVVLCTLVVMTGDLQLRSSRIDAVDVAWMRRWGEFSAPWAEAPNGTLCAQPVSGGSAALGTVVSTVARTVPTRNLAWLNHGFTYVNLAASASAHCTGAAWAVALDQASMVVVIPAPAIYIAAHRGDRPLLFGICSMLLLFAILGMRDVCIGMGLVTLFLVLYRHVPDARTQLCCAVLVLAVASAAWVLEQARRDLSVCRYGAAHAVWHTGGAVASALLVDALSLWDPSK